MIMIVITGATGHVGGGIADILLTAGSRIRVIGRSMERLRPLVERGAEAFQGDMSDPVFLTRAFSGAEAVFTLIPPNLQVENLHAYQGMIADSIARAVRDSGVKYVVNLSSIGADLAEGTGPVLGLRYLEEKLNMIPGIHVVHLRAGYFMENLYGSIAGIPSGFFGYSLKGDLKVPYIATRDIAAVASRYLMYHDFSGVTVRELLGQRDVTMNEIARILGKAIRNTKLKYTQVSYEAALKAMTDSGISTDVARSFVDLSRTANEGILYRNIKRTPESTTTIRIEDFVKILAASIKKAA
jgi:uncharacterized protein YbjT (DUF2867 family)